MKIGEIYKIGNKTCVLYNITEKYFTFGYLDKSNIVLKSIKKTEFKGSKIGKARYYKIEISGFISDFQGLMDTIRKMDILFFNIVIDGTIYIHIFTTKNLDFLISKLIKYWKRYIIGYEFKKIEVS